MMVKIGVALALASNILMASPAFAEQSMVLNGPTQMSNQTISQNIEVNGPFRVKGITVDGYVVVNGPVEGEGLKTEELRVKGPVSVRDSAIERMDVMGPLEADKLTVEDYIKVDGGVKISSSTIERLEARSSRVEIKDSKINQLIIPATKDGQQTVVLDGNTVIGDEISFESGKGVVVIKGAKVKHEGVRGGKISHHDQPLKNSQNSESKK